MSNKMQFDKAPRLCDLCNSQGAELYNKMLLCQNCKAKVKKHREERRLAR